MRTVWRRLCWVRDQNAQTNDRPLHQAEGGVQRCGSHAASGHAGAGRFSHNLPACLFHVLRCMVPVTVAILTQYQGTSANHTWRPWSASPPEGSCWDGLDARKTQTTEWLAPIWPTPEPFLAWSLNFLTKSFRPLLPVEGVTCFHNFNAFLITGM